MTILSLLIPNIVAAWVSAVICFALIVPIKYLFARRAPLEELSDRESASRQVVAGAIENDGERSNWRAKFNFTRWIIYVAANTAICAFIFVMIRESKPIMGEWVLFDPLYILGGAAIFIAQYPYMIGYSGWIKRVAAYSLTAIVGTAAIGLAVGSIGGALMAYLFAIQVIVPIILPFMLPFNLLWAQWLLKA